MKLQIQKLDPEAKIPSFFYKGDAGMDIFSIEDIEIPVGEKAAVRTGLKLAIPEGYAGFIWDKSGMAFQHHIKTMAGVIDSNYRGELLIVLTNLGKEPYRVEKGTKVAQMIISPITAPEIQETEIGDVTERGEKGFGSSDLKKVDYTATMMAFTQQVVKETPLAQQKPQREEQEHIPRPIWDQYFMMLSKLAAVMATCPKRRVGTVIVKNKRILTTGFNGAPPGLPHCTEVGCLIFPEEGSSCRRIIHAEENAVLQDSKSLEGATMYTSFLPCVDCMKAIVSAKIAEVVYEEEYPGTKGRYIYAKEFALGTNVKLRKIPKVDMMQILSTYYGNHENLPQRIAIYP